MFCGPPGWRSLGILRLRTAGDGGPYEFSGEYQRKTQRSGFALETKNNTIARCAKFTKAHELMGLF